MYDKKRAKSNALAIERELDNFETNHLVTDSLGRFRHYQYKEIWSHAKQITETFKTLKPLAREDREKLWQRYQVFCNNVKTKQNQERQESQTNASVIEREVEKLQTTHYHRNPFGEIKYYKYNEFWSHAKQITETFKTLKPLLRKDRESLWERYQSACDEMRAIQEREKHVSDMNREFIESKIKEAYHTAGGSTNIIGMLADIKMLEQARNLQTEVMKTMKEKSLTKQDRDACWTYWREVNETINQKREQMQEHNYINVKTEVGDAYNTAYQGDPYDAQQKIKECQRSMKELSIGKPHREELHDMLNEAWQKTISKIGEIKEEKRTRYLDWRERMESHLSRWEENIEKAESYVSNLEEQIERLGEQESSARSEDFAAMVRGWIQEKYDKITEVNEQIGGLERKIESTKSRLNEH